MISIPQLWMPLVFSAVGVFVVSSVVHMVLKYHKADYKQIPNEDVALAELRKSPPPPGYYHFPYCDDMKEAQGEAHQAKMKAGPVGMMAVIPSGPMNLGKFLGQWFVYCLLVSFFIAYLAGRTLAHGIDYLHVFRFVGAAAFLAYGLSSMVDSIWRGVPWANTFRSMFDGLLYACVTAGFFGWLWPR